MASYSNSNRQQLFNSNSTNYSNNNNNSHSKTNQHKQQQYHPEQSHLMLEQENNRMIDDLSDQVGLLKSLSLRIGKDLKEHDVIIGEMDNGFNNTGELLSAAMSKLSSLMNTGGANYFIILTVFIFCLFMAMYLFLRK